MLASCQAAAAALLRLGRSRPRRLRQQSASTRSRHQLLGVGTVGRWAGGWVAGQAGPQAQAGPGRPWQARGGPCKWAGQRAGGQTGSRAARQLASTPMEGRGHEAQWGEDVARTGACTGLSGPPPAGQVPNDTKHQVHLFFEAQRISLSLSLCLHPADNVT